VHAAFPNIPNAAANVVDVPAGDNSGQIVGNWKLAANTFYYFEPGVHTFGTGQYNDIGTLYAARSVFFGGGTASNPAILDGQNSNNYAFADRGTYITIEYLTIRNFVAPTDQYIVNHDQGDNWVEKFNTIGPNDNGGAGTGLGQNSVIQYNCFTENGQYGISGGSSNCATQIPGGGCKVFGVVIDHNEFDRNDYHTFTSGPAVNQSQNGWSTGSSGAGCPHCGYDNYPTPGGPLTSNGGYNNGFSGAMKLWIEWNAQVTNNWIHDTHSVGIWVDTINVGVTISGNYVANNWGAGVLYEVSYNAQITNNTFVNNDWIVGSRDTGQAWPAIYMSESGYDSRVSPNNGSGFTAISGNVFTDNWDGVTLWENSNRFCSSGQSTVECTEPEPNGNGSTGASLNSCTSPGQANGTAGELGDPSPQDPPTRLGDCRWQTKNIHVVLNTFNLNAANVNPQALTSYAALGAGSCTKMNHCGFNSTTSNASGNADYPNDVIPHSITWDQGNVFSNNAYNGPWRFDTNELGGSELTFAQWQTTMGSRGGTAMNTENHPAQDQGSNCNGCP
jgi:parallel beta-helix repeat protein